MSMGLCVLLYCQADPVLCKRLEEAGAATVMPLGAPIGTNKGLQTKEFLQIIIEQAGIPVVVDAGIGAPSHAAEAMELGASAVLVNTAIAVAGNRYGNRRKDVLRRADRTDGRNDDDDVRTEVNGTYANDERRNFNFNVR